MTDINHPVCVSSLPLSFFFICNLAARLSEGRRKKARIDLVFLQRGKEIEAAACSWRAEGTGVENGLRPSLDICVL